MEPSIEHRRLLQNLDPKGHESQSKTFAVEGEEVHGVLGVNVATMKTGQKIKAYLADFFGRAADLFGLGGEIVKSASSDTVWFVPQKSREGFRARFNEGKTDEKEKFTGKFVDFIKQHEIENVEKLKEFITSQGTINDEVKKRLKDFTFSAGPIAEVDRNFLNPKGLKDLLDLQITYLQARRGNSQKQFELAQTYEKNLQQFSDFKENAFEWYRNAAMLGHTEAQLWLGNYYREEKNAGNAVFWYEKAAEKGNPQAQYFLSTCYFGGYGVKADPQKGIELCEKAAKQGYHEAQRLLGDCYFEGRGGVNKDWAEAAVWYTKAAQQGNALAQNSLGELFAREKKWKEAVDWNTKAAQQGNSDAQESLGGYYMGGLGVEQNLQAGIDWYTKAAEQGRPWAMVQLGICYDSGKGVNKDEAKAFEWYKKAAEKGNAVAQNKLGDCYRFGRGVNHNEKQAFEYYEQAAKQGHRIGQNNLGYCYQHGIGIRKDEKAAFEWYQKAAEQENKDAQNNLGYCYQYGIGVEKNSKEAFECYRKAADSENASGLNNLGYCYQYGIGVEENPKEAFECYKNAAEQGHTDSQRNLGYCYFYAIGVNKDISKRSEWWEKAHRSESNQKDAILELNNEMEERE